MNSPNQDYGLLDANGNPVFSYLDKGAGQAHSIGATNFADLDLIAAAPELRDTLKWALECIKGDYETRDGTVRMAGYDEAMALLARLDKAGGA